MTKDEIKIVSSDFVTQFFSGHTRFELWEPDDLTQPSLYAFDDAGRRHPCPPTQATAMKARLDTFFGIQE